MNQQFAKCQDAKCLSVILTVVQGIRQFTISSLCLLSFMSKLSSSISDKSHVLSREVWLLVVKVNALTFSVAKGTSIHVI